MAFDSRINRRIFSRIEAAEKSRRWFGVFLTTCLLTLILFIAEIS